MTALLTMDEPKDIGGHVYFIRSGDFIKIGWSKHFVRRIKHMRGMSPHPMKLIGILEGDRNIERILHRQFVSLRVNGEWFKNEGELTTYIAERTEAGLWTISEIARAYAEAFAGGRE